MSFKFIYLDEKYIDSIKKQLTLDENKIQF